jgi:serine/threonine protein kinase
MDNELNGGCMTAWALCLAAPACTAWSGTVLEDDNVALSRLHAVVQSNEFRDFELPKDFYVSMGHILNNLVRRATPTQTVGAILPVNVRNGYELVIGVMSSIEFYAVMSECWTPTFLGSLVTNISRRMTMTSEDNLKHQERGMDRMGGVASGTATPDATQPVSGSLSSVRGSGESAASIVAPIVVMRERPDKAKVATIGTRSVPHISNLDELVLLRCALAFLHVHMPLQRPKIVSCVLQELSDFAASSARQHAAVSKHMLMLLEAIVRGCSVSDGSRASLLNKAFDVLLELHHVHGIIAEGMATLVLLHEPLTQCLMHLISASQVPDALRRTIAAIQSAWMDVRLGNSSKGVLFIHEIEQLLNCQTQHNPDDVGRYIEQATEVICEAVESENSRLAQLALGLFKSPHVVDAFLKRPKDIHFRAIVRALLRNGKPHWNATVNKVTHTVLSKFMEAAPKQTLEAVESIWKRGATTPTVDRPSKVPRSAYEDTAARSEKPPAPLAPSAITGVAPWSVRPSASMAFDKSKPPPITITGVAPWAVSKVDKPVVLKPAPTEEDTEEADTKTRFEKFLASLQPVAKSALAMYGSEAIEESAIDVLAAKPTLLPSLAFHDLVFGKELGAGTFSVVRYAKHIRRGSPANSWPEYAVKIISTRTMAELGYEASVRREIAVLSVLTHPNVARLVSAFRWRDGAYLVCEYASRGDLHTTLVSLGSLDVPTVRFLFAEVIVALIHIHSKGFVYGDCKPENILLVEDKSGGCHAKLTDFGACRPLKPDAHALVANSRQILQNLRDGDWRARLGIAVADQAGAAAAQATQDETPISVDDVDEVDERNEGTEEYLAPEITQRGEALSIASDAFAVGVSIFQCVTGNLPVTEDIWPTTGEGVNEERRLRFQHSAVFSDDVPEDLRDLISQFLNPDPASRLGGGEQGLRAALAHPFFASLGPVDAFETLYDRPAVPIARGNAAPPVDPAWSRRHNSTMWAPMPKAYINPSDISTSMPRRTADPDSFVTLRALMMAPVLPALCS